MKKRKKIIIISIASAIVAATAIAVPIAIVASKKETADKVYFSFSTGIKSGASIIQYGEGASTEYVAVYDNGIDTADREYTFTSTDKTVATIDQEGKITPIKEGKVNFIVTETKSGDKQSLKKDIQVVPFAGSSNGGYNYAGGTTTPELEKRAEILGKLEKYAMDTHLTGITLFDNGGYVKYSERVRLPVQDYVEGFGFGLLSDGELVGELPGTDGGNLYKSYLHSSIAQDSLKINQYTASGSQVSDLASYITSSYWNTKLAGQDSYEWFPCLATENLEKIPVVTPAEVTIEHPKNYDIVMTEPGVARPEAEHPEYNNEPIPMEVKNSTGLYKKWRIYVKTYDAEKNPGMVYHTNSAKLKGQGFDGKHVLLDDYMYIYKLLLTGSNSIIRGTEMANDTSYGIKGAQRYFNETKGLKTLPEINAKWAEFTAVDAKGESKLGLQSGHDENGDYIDIELINPIDSFTAMYTLSSSLTSPLPSALFEGSLAIAGDLKSAIQNYGTFNNKGDNAILDYTLCLGAFTLEKWAKNSEIVFKQNTDWFEHTEQGRYKIPGVYYRVIDVSTDTEKNWKQLEAGNLDSAGVPSKKVETNKDKPGVKATKGDATFKLNVNSCTQDQWNELFGKQGKWPADGDWEIKPWMSNQDFLDGLFYSIDRVAFANKRGVTPSINYFSDAYQMRNSEGGSAYNATQAHKDAVAGYETYNKAGVSDFGYNYDKAVNCFRNAVNQLSQQGKIVLGKNKANATTIKIHIRWMYQTDIKEYGEDIKSYFETAFNDDAVCGGRVKLQVEQDAVTNWEDVYNVWMMQGRFDLGFGAISGNTYNPLNFMEVLKSDNSSSFTLNWGPDTSKVDEKNPIIYDGKKWSFDALWEVADHGGIVRNGEKEDAIKSCTYERARDLDNVNYNSNLYDGYTITIPVEFAEFEDESAGKVIFDFNRLDLYIFGYGNVTLSENKACYDKVNKKVVVQVPKTLAQSINSTIKTHKGYKDDDKEAWHKNPFIESQLDELFSYEFYYEIKIGEEGSASVNYSPVKSADE